MHDVPLSQHPFFFLFVKRIEQVKQAALPETIKLGDCIGSIVFWLGLVAIL